MGVNYYGVRSDIFFRKTMMDSKLSYNELFVVKSLSQSFGYEWRSGEDPPDVYLITDSEEIAVEISILTQHVQNQSGDMEPRHSQDTGPYRICNELNKELKEVIRHNTYIQLIIETPIDGEKKFKKSLKEKLIELINVGEFKEATYNIRGSDVRITLREGERPSEKKVVGIILNRNANPDLSLNVASILYGRISKKSSKCSNIKHRPLWLALYNNFFITDPIDYKNVMNNYSGDHQFEKIYLVSHNMDVDVLYET